MQRLHFILLSISFFLNRCACTCSKFKRYVLKIRSPSLPRLSRPFSQRQLVSSDVFCILLETFLYICEQAHFRWFIHSLNKDFLSALRVPGSVPGYRTAGSWHHLLHPSFLPLLQEHVILCFLSTLTYDWESLSYQFTLWIYHNLLASTCWIRHFRLFLGVFFPYYKQ